MGLSGRWKGEKGFFETAHCFYPKREERLRGPLSLRTLPWAREGSSESPVICPFPSFVMETSTHLVEFFQLLIQKIGNNLGSLLNQLDNQARRACPQIVSTRLVESQWGICHVQAFGGSGWLRKQES